MSIMLFVILKAICAGVAWVWLGRVYIRVHRYQCYVWAYASGMNTYKLALAF